MEIKYLSYCNKYQFCINGYNSGILNDTVCFSHLFSRSDNKNDGWIKIWICGDETLNKKNKSNYCILTEKELRFYFNIVRDLTGIKFTCLKKDKIEMAGEECSGYMVIAKIDKKSYYMVTTFVTLIRNVYESPFNIQLKTAMLMKNTPEFKRLDFVQKMTLAINSIKNDNNRDVHAIYKVYRDLELLKKAELATRMINRTGSVSDTLKAREVQECEKLCLEDDCEAFYNIENNLMSNSLHRKLVENYKLLKNNNE